MNKAETEGQNNHHHKIQKSGENIQQKYEWVPQEAAKIIRLIDPFYEGGKEIGSWGVKNTLMEP